MRKSYIITYYTLLIFILLPYLSYSQTLTKGQKPDPLFAKYCLKFNNYYDGLIEFSALLNINPENDYYRWGVGYCHLHQNVDKGKSIPYFITVLSKSDADQSVWYDLGDAYFQTYQLDKAEEAFQNYIKAGINDTHKIPAKRQLEMISNARKSMLNPVDVKIENAGIEVNSEFPDFNPYINSTEKILIFSVQSSANSGTYRHEDGFYASDVYSSNFKFGHWKKRKRYSSMINSSNIEINGYLSSNGAYLLVYNEDLLGKQKMFQLFEKRGVAYGYPSIVQIPGVDMFYVHSLMINNEGNMLVFSAPKSLSSSGDYDLFYSIKSPDGNWLIPIAFGAEVNSTFDEQNPYFDCNGEYLYFASQGHNSMGGFDLFKSEIRKDSLSLSSPINLGYPVNTALDDRTISFNSTGRYAYIAGLRPDGFGDIDIYRVVFNQIDPKYTVIHGAIFNEDSVPLTHIINQWNDHIDTLNFPVNHEFKRILEKEKDSVKAYSYLQLNKIPYQNLDVTIQVFDKVSQQNVGKFKVDNNTGKYNIILPPGEYSVQFSRKEFETANLQFEINDYDLRKNIVLQNIKLQSKSSN